MSKKSNVHPDHYKTAAAGRATTSCKKERPRVCAVSAGQHQARSRRCSKGATKGEATRAIEKAQAGHHETNQPAGVW